jgi:hypothetical protein
MKILVLPFILLSSLVLSQKVIPYEDFNFYFKSFQNGQVRQVEFQRIEEFKAGDDLVAYMDNRGNLRVYDGGKPKDLANTNVIYEVSDHLLVWQIGETLNVWDQGHMETLTYNCEQFAIRDSIVVYTDKRYNSVNVYQNKEKKAIMQSTSSLYMPNAIGENVVAYKDNGDYYKIYWNGKITDIDVWLGSVDFQVGTDVIAFNDPTTRTFAVFDKGELTDVEDFFVKKYKAGRGFVAYEDLNGNLYKYKDGQRKLLSTFASDFWEVKDDVIIWQENSFLHMESGESKWQVCNYLPTNYLLKNDVLVFTNAMGGVSVSHKGKTLVLTTQQDVTYDIYGSSVLLRLFNNSYMVYQNGEKFEL